MSWLCSRWACYLIYLRPCSHGGFQHRICMYSSRNPPFIRHTMNYDAIFTFVDSRKKKWVTCHLLTQKPRLVDRMQKSPIQWGVSTSIIRAKSVAEIQGNCFGFLPWIHKADFFQWKNPSCEQGPNCVKVFLLTARRDLKKSNDLKHTVC